MKSEYVNYPQEGKTQRVTIEGGKVKRENLPKAPEAAAKTGAAAELKAISDAKRAELVEKNIMGGAAANLRAVAKIEPREFEPNAGLGAEVEEYESLFQGAEGQKLKAESDVLNAMRQADIDAAQAARKTRIAPAPKVKPSFWNRLAKAFGGGQEQPRS